MPTTIDRPSAPRILVVLVGGLFMAASGPSPGAPPEAAPERGNTAPNEESGASAEDGEASSGALVPLNEKKTVLLDRPGKRVLLKSKVVLRNGLLEMFCCLKNTKEHESILAVDAKAYVIHTGLLALGAEPGRPVQFVRPDPENPEKQIEEYRPPTGQRIDVFVQWTDEKGKLHRKPAQKWIRYALHRFYLEDLKQRPEDLKIPDDSRLRYHEDSGELSWYGPMSDGERDELLGLSEGKKYRKIIRSFYRRTRPKPMDADWVFAGSGFSVDERTGKKRYLAEGGDLICVANFPTAMLDVTRRSSSSNDALMFEAWTERIPPLGTEVTVELVPVFENDGTKEE